VRRFLLRLITAIQLTRLTMAFGAVSDLWFIILLTRALPEYAGVEVHSMDLLGALAAAAIVAVGLFAFSSSLNDVLDARHDSAFSPERPIPAGRIRVSQAIVVTAGSLMVAVVAGLAFGKVPLLLTVLTAAGILFYNAAGKHVPAIGLIVIGLVHALHMLIPNPQLTFTLPVWLVMTHAIGIAAAVHVFEDKRPRLSRHAIAGTVAGYVFWSVVIIGSGVWRGSLWPPETSPLGLAWPFLAVVGFIVVARRKTARVPGRSAAEKIKRYGAMWQSLYGAAWLLALGLVTPAMWIGALAIAGFITMTIIREAYGLTGRPVAYRG
jgi:hypothetical protein